MSAGVAGRLDGFVGWPEELERCYTDAGYWGDQTLGGLLRGWAGRDPDGLALVAGRTRLSYRELDARADAMAAGLGAHGIGPGDRVVLQLPNVVEFVIVFFALVRLGAIPVLTLPAHRRAEIGHVAALTDAVGYVIAERYEGFDYRTLAGQVRAGAPSLRSVFVLGDPGPAPGFHALAGVPVEPPGPVADPAHPEQVALLLMSGGTTGKPKLIPRTHRDYAYNAAATARVCGLTSEDVYLACLPIGHNLPFACPGVLGTLAVGGTVVLAPGPAVDVALELVERERVTACALVPPLARLWVEQAATAGRDLSSLRWLMIGGARCDAELAARVGPVLGARLIQSLGMAEGLLTHTRPEDPEDVVLTTQGRPLSPADEIRVLDRDGRPVPQGHIGELWTRGPYTLRGYYRAPEYNRVAFDADGFFRTGDLVRALPSGHLVVEGRVKEVINRGGENVSEAELEAELLAHPSVAEAAVFGLPDPDLGEIVCAALVVAGPAGRAPKLKEIKAFLRERGLASFKHPDRLRIVDRFPLTAVGKVDKRALALAATS